ncbi:type II secretory pathway component PulM [Fluviicoccus keumensis]|uniref:Type II secretory pathway component PulM n=1 Tax=Fluviicoccus keumensis TaxID=1435465 RepID=A0A4Q7Z4D9_9GAMM|nr:type II secretion system protein GspM [Fluviicoccus keumensis]RZU45167.1 type II secretory pathway component PulM [Fluviicoccus keumensis]
MLNDIQKYLDGLPPRDRLALIAMGVFLMVSVIGLGGLKLHRAANKAEDQAVQEQATLSWLQSLAPQLSGGGLAGGTLSVLDIVSSAAAGQGITMQRFEPDGNRVRVWLEGADFAKVAAWMDMLERQGVKSQEVHFEQSEKGLNVRLVFGR